MIMKIFLSTITENASQSFVDAFMMTRDSNLLLICLLLSNYSISELQSEF